jgi:hypothetical protein
MGITPKSYNSTLDALNYSKLNKSLTSGKKAIEHIVSSNQAMMSFFSNTAERHNQINLSVVLS